LIAPYMKKCGFQSTRMYSDDDRTCFGFRNKFISYLVEIVHDDFNFQRLNKKHVFLLGISY
jgi:hypothetical protein